MATERERISGDRLRALVDAGIDLASDLSLERVLQRLVDTAAELTDARYAALGLIDPSGRELEQFVTTGVDEETRAAIGTLPRGRGILGLLIADAKPLRLHDLTEDPRSVGFPPGHPPMRTFLGVPVVLRGEAYGNLYLTEKRGQADFTDEDEELVSLLAAQAAVAVENARLYESSVRWTRQLESLEEIATALSGELELTPLLTLIVARLRELIAARLAFVALPTPSGDLRVATAVGEHADDATGLLLRRGESRTSRVFERGVSERSDSVIDDPEVDQDAARRLGALAAVYAPLLVRGKPIGVLVAHNKVGRDPRFSDDDLRLTEAFGARAAIAADLSQRVARASLERVLAAQELERRRLALELHDETGQALTSILLGIRAIEDAENEADLRAGAAALRELVTATLHDVRALAVELRPKVLDDFGLTPALERLVELYGERTGMDVQLAVNVGAERLPSGVETALYRIVQEALTNIAKHARARNVSVVVTRHGAAVTAVIEDDGIGFSAGEVEEGLGLVGMRERVALLQGRLEIESSAGRGTTLVAEVPVP